MNIEVVTPEIALKEVTGWLDKKRVMGKEREKKQDEIDVMVDAVVNGILSIDEAGIITHKLLFPVEDKDGNIAIDTLSYRLRIDTATINQKLQGVKMDMSMISAYGAALTGRLIGEVNKLDTQDSKILRTIATFFM